MLPTHRLEAVIPRLTAEQYAQLVEYAETLAAGNNIRQAATAAKRRLARKFPESARLRLRELTRKSEDESLNEEERREYIALAERREETDAERLEAAAQLVSQHGIALPQALAIFDLGAERRG
jgi:anti-sigma factor ChrR (cupin superfamily)